MQHRFLCSTHKHTWEIHSSGYLKAGLLECVGKARQGKDRDSVLRCRLVATAAPTNAVAAEELGCSPHTMVHWRVRRAEARSVPKNLSPSLQSHCCGNVSEATCYSTAVQLAIRNKEAALRACEPSSSPPATSRHHDCGAPRHWGNTDTAGIPTIPITQTSISMITVTTSPTQLPESKYSRWEKTKTELNLLENERNASTYQPAKVLR